MKRRSVAFQQDENLARIATVEEVQKHEGTAAFKRSDTETNTLIWEREHVPWILHEKLGSGPKTMANS